MKRERMKMKKRDSMTEGKVLAMDSRIARNGQASRVVLCNQYITITRKGNRMFYKKSQCLARI